MWEDAGWHLQYQVNELGQAAGVSWFPDQLEAFAGTALQDAPLRACLYYRTGAGKSVTALVTVLLRGHTEALVVTPPSTYDTWRAQAHKLGMSVTCISHAKFRMKDTKISRSMAVIADEFHLFGGHGGKGWKKLDGLARGLQAPLVLASATPNYNDAERVYCIQHVLDPQSVRGGYLEFLYRECETEQNPFGQEPIVKGFRRFKDASEYLSSLPGVYYLPDNLVYSIDDVTLSAPMPREFEHFGLDERSGRMIASIIEAKHKRVFNGLTEKQGQFNVVKRDVYEQLARWVGDSATPVLIYANHSTVAVALGNNLYANRVKHAVVTGDTPAKKKAAYIDAFRAGVLDVLVGTATLATGTDGLDRVCDTLVILDDTDDDALRRQLIGRIMPRGSSVDTSKKRVHRIVLDHG